MFGKKGKINLIGFLVELGGALVVSFGVFSIALRAFPELIAEFLVAVGTLVMVIGRFLR